MQGIVTKSTGSWYVVKINEKNAPSYFIDCRIRGKFKLEDINSTNPVAVGDEVIIEIEGETGIITEIFSRKNYIIRSSPKHRKASHIIAANLDLAVLIATLSHPRTSLGFIDRFLVTANAYNVPACLIFNKADIYTKKENDKLQEIFSLYKKSGYSSFLICATEKVNLETIKDLVKDKMVLFSGHSGSGKSTLINSLSPELEIKTSKISKQTEKGIHTTTFAEMYQMPFGGMVIDTPGIKEFGLIEMKPEEVSHYFPEMVNLLNQCKFDNCLHIDEPQCAVKKALKENKIAVSRYENYRGMINELKEKKREEYK